VAQAFASGSAAQAVGMPRVWPPNSGGKTYFAAWTRNSSRALRRMLHIDDPERVRVYRELLVTAEPPTIADSDERGRRLLLMLHYDLWGTRRRFANLDASLRAFWPHEPVRQELHELLGVLDARSATFTRPSNLAPEIPLHAHATYSRDEILGAYGEGSPAQPPQFRGGVRHVESAATDLLLITLKKAERDYSPTTLYRDYAIAPDRFHWESQSTQSAGSPTIRRYEQHAARNHTIVLFVRERRTLETGVGSAYVCLGPARYVALLRIPAGLVHLGTGYSDAWGAVRVRSQGRGRVMERGRA
jgi:hypothetical protein